MEGQLRCSGRVGNSCSTSGTRRCTLVTSPIIQMRINSVIMNNDVISIAEGKSCEPITVPMCKDIGYTMTQFPNSLGHTRQHEAGLEAHQFYPLVKINCSEHLKEFICALYFPKCDPNEVSTELVLPKQQLCQMSRDGCEPLMNKYGFDWPDKMKCEKFPGKLNNRENKLLACG